MLKGIDISNWNKNVKIDDYDFVIMKSSEGHGWKDPLMDSHLKNVLSQKKLFGFYHYARPDLVNKAVDEAKYFVSLIKNYIGKCILALDWEQRSLNYSTDWALTWLKEVEKLTGVKPLIYISASVENSNQFKKIKENNNGLWVAHWGVSKPSVKCWDFYAFWQYQGDPLDKDYFNGNKEQFLKYCESKKPNKKPLNTNSSKPNNAIKIGSKVTPITVYDYNGVKNDSWVLSTVFDVMEIKGNRVVIGRNGQLTGAWKKENLKLK